MELPKNAQWYNQSKGIYREVITPYTDEWFERRKAGIGGSDVGRVLGLSDWPGSSVIELFYEKIGIKPQQKESNKFTFFGNYLESAVADLWKYHDGDKDSIIRNFESKNPVRECRNVNGFLSNVKYPHLYVNIDRLIQKGSFKLTDGSILEDNGVLECKTASTYVARKWEDGVPPQYVMQVIQQCMVMDVDYAEIAVMVLDNREVSVYPIEPTQESKDIILEHTTHFWEKMIKPAKELYNEMQLEISRGNTSKAEKLMHQIELLEPPADNSDSYKEFMNKRWLSEPVIVKADDEMLSTIMNFVTAKDLIKAVEADKTLFENLIREYMRENDTMDCGGFGKITWKTGAKARTMSTEGFRYDTSDKVNQIVDVIKSKYE